MTLKEEIIDTILKARDVPWGARGTLHDREQGTYCFYAQLTHLKPLPLEETMSEAEVVSAHARRWIYPQQTSAANRRGFDFVSEFSDDPSTTQSDIDQAWDEILLAAKELPEDFAR